MVFIIRERKNLFTDYGKAVCKRLIELDKSQNWLIEQISKKTGMFIDSSLLNKILTGRVNSERIMTAIDEIIAERNGTN